MKLLKGLLHWWRYVTSEDLGLFGLREHGWRVRYRDGVSQSMPYATACDYAEMFDGVVERNTAQPLASKECAGGGACPPIAPADR